MTTLDVCPADTVHAPVERVWDLLMQPAGYDRFWDLTVERLEPEGPAVVGQKFVGWTKSLFWRRRLEGEIQELDAERHQILFQMSLPLGLISSNRIMCGPDRRAVVHAALRLRLHIPPRMAGLVLAGLPASAFRKSVADSLQRLKRAAEVEAQKAGPIVQPGS